MMKKNKLSKETRKVCFEMFIDDIIGGNCKIIGNKNHSNQKIFIIIKYNYPYCIPYVEDDEKIF